MATTPESPTISPLAAYRSYITKNVLVAFKTTDDAVSTVITKDIGKCGQTVTGSGCGEKGVVIVNEFTDNKFIVYSHENEFSFHSFFDYSTSSMTGTVTIIDSVGGLFQNFLRDVASKVLDISETHIIFCLKTFIIGTKTDGTMETLTMKPLLFHVYNITHSFNDSDKLQNFYTLLYVADYNTFALLPNYSRMFQMTITHQDSSSPGDSIALNAFVDTPTPTPTETIKVTQTVTPTPVTSLTPTPTVTDAAAPSTFSISSAGINIIKEFEGLSLTAYWDVNAYAIGYGHRRGVTEGMTIDQQQADDFLMEDLVWAQNAVRTKVTVYITQGMYDALCSLTYNVGTNGYRTLLAKLNAGDYTGAQDAFNLYIYSGGKVNQSLVNRRADEAAIFGNQTPPSGNQPLPSTTVNAASSYQDIDVKKRNQYLEEYRNARLQSDRTMMTLQDIMEGFQAALKSQKTPPAQNLSEWLSTINQGYTKPLLPNDQKKSDGVLPIDYNIKLDTIYNDYVINNRNIPFEQPEQSQVSYGIKSYQVKSGKNLTKTINNLMKLSNQVGEDAIGGDKSQKSYKCNISCIKTCADTYQFDIHIVHYIVPLNSTTYDTGPGKGEGYYKPMIFNYQDSAKNRNVVSLSMSLFSDSSLGIMSQPFNSTDNRSLYGSREQIMLERNPDIGFFKTSYSGLRGMANPKNFGLERPNGPVSIDNLVKTNLIQQSKMTASILGNPYLLSDLYRNPIKVVAMDADSPNYYKFPEHYPMYAKLNVYLRPSNIIGLKPDKNTPREYYYKGYYHLAKVKSTFTGDTFFQTLELYRTDDVS